MGDKLQAIHLATPHPNPLPGGERELTSSPAPPGRGAGGEGKAARQYKTRQKSELAPLLQTFAKEMRLAPTDAEGRLWYFLRNRRMCGHKFRRQHTVGRFILDYVCIESRLVIELDGGQHAENTTYDDERARYLEQRGMRVLRFWNDDVLLRCELVLEEIWRALEGNLHNTPHPLPLSPKGRGEHETPSPLRGEGWGEGNHPHQGGKK